MAITDKNIQSRLTSYRARFTPQAWIRDWAVDIDPEGDTEWDVSGEFLAHLIGWHMRDYDMSFEDALAVCIRQSTDSSDNLRKDPAAPEWIREHNGPFYCEAWPIDQDES
jgi:hypothetical protein